MNVLIIGSKGFIGSHCVAHFSKIGKVWECDVVSDYDNPRYFLIDSSQTNFEQCFKNQNFDLCINCSGAASVPDSVNNPKRDFFLNVMNVHLILNAIRQYNDTCKFINLGSAAVYGNPETLPVKEEQKRKPVSPYGYHKMMAETMVEEFYNFYKINCCTVRIFSAFGEGLKKQLFWDLYKKAQHNTDVDLFGTGNETRDFIHVSDLVLALQKIYEHHNFMGDTINLASGIETEIRSAVSVFYKHLGFTGAVNFKGATRKGDPTNWVADISHLNTLGFKPQTSLDAGLEKYVEWLNAID